MLIFLRGHDGLSGIKLTCGIGKEQLQEPGPLESGVFFLVMIERRERERVGCLIDEVEIGFLDSTGEEANVDG